MPTRRGRSSASRSPRRSRRCRPQRPTSRSSGTTPVRFITLTEDEARGRHPLHRPPPREPAPAGHVRLDEQDHVCRGRRRLPRRQSRECRLVADALSVRVDRPGQGQPAAACPVLQDRPGVRDHMVRHREILAPKFAAVDAALTAELGGLGIATWSKPTGVFRQSRRPRRDRRASGRAGEGGRHRADPCRRVVPARTRPHDRNIRLAPSFPVLADVGRRWRASPRAWRWPPRRSSRHGIRPARARLRENDVMSGSAKSSATI